MSADGFVPVLPALVQERRELKASVDQLQADPSTTVITGNFELQGVQDRWDHLFWRLDEQGAAFETVFETVFERLFEKFNLKAEEKFSAAAEKLRDENFVRHIDWQIEMDEFEEALGRLSRSVKRKDIDMGGLRKFIDDLEGGLDNGFYEKLKQWLETRIQKMRKEQEDREAKEAFEKKEAGEKGNVAK